MAGAAPSPIGHTPVCSASAALATDSLDPTLSLCFQLLYLTGANVQGPPSLIAGSLVFFGKHSLGCFLCLSRVVRIT